MAEALVEKTSEKVRAFRLFLIIAILGFAIHILLPQIGEIGQAFWDGSRPQTTICRWGALMSTPPTQQQPST